MAKEWPLVWGRGAVRLDGDRLEVRRWLRKPRVVDLAAVRVRIARWSYPGSPGIGAAVIAGEVSVASAYTPRKTTFDGEVMRPMAIVAQDSLRELLELIGDRIAKPAVDPTVAAGPARYRLVPRASRDGTLAVLAIPALAIVMMIPAAIEGGQLYAVPICAVALVGVAVVARWIWRRSAPLELEIDGDVVKLGDQRGKRGELAGAIGHIAMYSRFASAKWPAIAFTVGDRRVVVASMEAIANPRGSVLRGASYMLAADEHERLAQTLRLR